MTTEGPIRYVDQQFDNDYPFPFIVIIIECTGTEQNDQWPQANRELRKTTINTGKHAKSIDHSSRFFGIKKELRFFSIERDHFNGHNLLQINHEM